MWQRQQRASGGSSLDCGEPAQPRVRLDEQFAAWLAEAFRGRRAARQPRKKSTAQFARTRPSCGHGQAYHRGTPFARARPEMHDVICPFLVYLDVQQAMAELSDVALGLADGDPALLITNRGSARVVAGIRLVMRAGRIWRPDGLGVIPGARRAADRSGARPAHLQRPPWPYRRPPRHTLVPARCGPLPAGSST